MIPYLLVHKKFVNVPTTPSSPTNFRAILSAKMDEFPWAMLANGPACTKTGVPWNKKIQKEKMLTALHALSLKTKTFIYIRKAAIQNYTLNRNFSLLSFYQYHCVRRAIQSYYSIA